MKKSPGRKQRHFKERAETIAARKEVRKKGKPLERNVPEAVKLARANNNIGKPLRWCIPTGHAKLTASLFGERPGWKSLPDDTSIVVLSDRELQELLANSSNLDYDAEYNTLYCLDNERVWVVVKPMAVSVRILNVNGEPVKGITINLFKGGKS